MDYVTADLHFGHKSIIKFQERNKFETIEDHDNFIIRQLNATLKPNDTLYVLGDVGFRSPSQTLAELGQKIRRIECARKVLIMGNHDRFSPIEAISILGFDEVHRGPIYYHHAEAHGKIILSHEPVREALDNPFVINVHGHIHNYKLNLPGFYNVNIGMNAYRPIPMNRFVNLARNCKKRTEPFGQEWYYQYYDLPKGEKDEREKENIS